MFKRKIKEEEKQESSNFELPPLSRKEAYVLALLSNGGREMFGLEMIEASGGELKRGTIYVTLQRMQEKCFIDSRQEARPAPEVGIPRRLYRITGLGSRVLAAYEAARSIMSADVIMAE